MWVPVLALPL
jgi:hypothetical protein